MSTRIRFFLLTLSGIGIFALGYGTASLERKTQDRPLSEAGIFSHLPKRSAAKGSFSSENPERGGSGGATGGAAMLPNDQVHLDLSLVLENPNRESRERDLTEIGRQDFRSGRDWQSASATIGDLVDRSFYLRGVVEAWALVDPRATVDHLSGLGLSARFDFIPRAVSIWASTDPEAAEGWALSLDHGEVRDLVLESLYRSWAVLDPETAITRSLALEEDDSRHRALAGVVQEWSANDLAAAGQWARSLKDPNLKDFATMAVADEMSTRAPREAMRWASEHLASDPQANPEIVALVASKAGFESPSETFEWLKSVPPSPEAASSLAGVATYLVEDDPSFAWEGFAELSENLRSLVGPAVASTLGSQDPEAGIRWLAQQRAGESKNRSTGAFAAGWYQRNPLKAEAWVEQLPDGPEKDAASRGLSASNGETGGSAVSRSTP